MFELATCGKEVFIKKQNGKGSQAGSYDVESHLNKKVDICLSARLSVTSKLIAKDGILQNLTSEKTGNAHNTAKPSEQFIRLKKTTKVPLFMRRTTTYTYNLVQL